MKDSIDLHFATCCSIDSHSRVTLYLFAGLLPELPDEQVMQIFTQSKLPHHS